MGRRAKAHIGPKGTAAKNPAAKAAAQSGATADAAAEGSVVGAGPQLPSGSSWNADLLTSFRVALEELQEVWPGIKDEEPVSIADGGAQAGERCIRHLSLPRPLGGSKN